MAGLAHEADLTPLFPLLELIERREEGEGTLPFVIIVQHPTLTFFDRMAKVVLDRRAGVSYLFHNRVTNVDDLPRGHYLAVNVEDGRAMVNIKPSTCLQQFERNKRFGGTAVEGITVVTYEPEILRHHYIDLPGSRNDADYVPYLDLAHHGPELLSDWRDDPHPNYGSMSCGWRLGLGNSRPGIRT